MNKVQGEGEIGLLITQVTKVLKSRFLFVGTKTKTIIKFWLVLFYPLKSLTKLYTLSVEKIIIQNNYWYGTKQSKSKKSFWVNK